MKVGLFARRVWDGEAGPLERGVGRLVAPLARVYGAAVAARNAFWEHRGGVRVQGARVVSVGNLAVGGTGKTPVARWAVRLATDAGRDVALVSRGYGRDEVLLHARWNPECPVEVDVDRVAAVRRAVAEGADLVVVDDGFQHRRLSRDVDLVLLAAEDPLPARLLPAGPYREPMAALNRADAVILTHRTASEAAVSALVDAAAAAAPQVPLARVRLTSGGWTDLDGTPRPPPDRPVLVVTSVARPASVVVQAQAAARVEADLMAFADHHDFTGPDVRAVLERAQGRPVVVTEKDAVKLLPFGGEMGDVSVLLQNVVWEEGEETIRRLVLGEEGAP